MTTLERCSEKQAAPVTGIVAEGGGSRAAYTAGVLNALLDNQITADQAFGISAASLMLAAYVSQQPERLQVSGRQLFAQKDCIGLSALLKEGCLVGLKHAQTYLQETVPLDLNAIHAASTKLYTGMYSMDSHQIEYADNQALGDDFLVLRATSSLPVLSHPVEIDGSLYMDGGIKDMLPIEESLRQGTERHLVISTKPQNYRRPPTPAWQIGLAGLLYHNRGLCDDLKQRHLLYARQVELVDRLEQQGKALVLRPSKNLPMSRYTTSESLLDECFQLGYGDAMEKIDQIRRFFSQ